MNLDEIRREIRDSEFIINKIENLEAENRRFESRLSSIVTEINQVMEAREFLLMFSEYIRDKMKDRVESLVNISLKSVFTDKSLIFKIIPNKTKKGLLYDLYVETDGVITPLKDCKGGGVMDIITMALKISFLRMFSARLRQTMILDEPFKNLDKERIVRATEWLHLVSVEFGMQFIIITHIEELVSNSDRVFRFSLEDGVTKVETKQG